MRAQNAGGSVKDRIGKRMILDAEKAGRIKPGDTLIEPTSGNTGIGLAITALLRGYRMIITLPEKMSDEKMNMLKALGAEIIRTPTEAAWDAPESHIGVAKKLQAQIPNSHILDQYENASNPLAHYEGTAEEILYQCDGQLDAVVCGAGTGGTISGIARKLKERLPHVKVIGVDPVGSILAQPSSLNVPGPAYLVEGIGYDFIPNVLNRSLVDEWIKTDDEASLTMARRLIREEGMLCGGSSGAAMHAATLVARRFGPGQRVVVLLPDSTRNYMTKFLSDAWMMDKGIEPPLTHPSSFPHGGAPAVSLLDAPHSKAPQAQWWSAHTVVDLKLPAPITVPPSMACADAAGVMKQHSIDQLPVVHEAGNVVGVVTLGSLTAKILSGHVAPHDAVSHVMFTTFAQVPLGTTLAEFGPIFERHAYCLVVTPTHSYSSNKELAPHKRKVVVAVVTHSDILEYVVRGGGSAPPRQQLTASPLVHDPAQLTCSQMAWSFMKAQPQPPKVPPASLVLEKDPVQLQCAQMAWSFMKPPRSPGLSPSKPEATAKPEAAAPLAPGAAEGVGTDVLNCSQMAWAFMKPSSMPSAIQDTKAYAKPSPMLATTEGETLPSMELWPHTTDSQRASAAATVQASPVKSAAEGVKGMPKMKLSR